MEYRTYVLWKVLQWIKFCIYFYLNYKDFLNWNVILHKKDHERWLGSFTNKRCIYTLEFHKITVYNKFSIFLLPNCVFCWSPTEQLNFFQCLTPSTTKLVKLLLPTFTTDSYLDFPYKHLHHKQVFLHSTCAKILDIHFESILPWYFLLSGIYTGAKRWKTGVHVCASDLEKELIESKE